MAVYTILVGPYYILRRPSTILLIQRLRTEWLEVNRHLKCLLQPELCQMGPRRRLPSEHPREI